MLRRSAIPLFLLLLCGTAAPALAQTTTQPGSQPASGGQCSYNDYLQNLGRSEGQYGKKNTTDGDTVYFGRYQMNYEALQTAGVAKAGSTKSNIIWADGYSESYFLGNPDVQDAAYQRYAQKNWGYLMDVGAGDFLGRRLDDGTVITQSGLLKAGQFGPVRMENFVNNGGVCDRSTSDGNGLCLTEYMRSGAGFDVSNITGMPSDVDGQCEQTNPVQEEQPYQGDTTSKTCIPTVPMLQNIPCGEYPASLQGFCYRYKPLMMTMPMCQAAERWAENVPPSGPHLESCKTQTFRDGTSSWSYVHACAKAEPAMGATGKDNAQQKVVGAADDPACYERLKGMGVEFQPLGKMDISTGGRTCIIPNAVQYSGTAIPMDRSVTLNCALVEQIERFGPQARSMGVTQYQVLGTLDCRGINNKQGTGQAKTSLHGFGNAIDINGFQTGSGLMRTNEYWSNPSKRQWLEQLKQMGCSNFDGTLAYNFYKDTSWTHVHWQATEATSCDPNG